MGRVRVNINNVGAVDVQDYSIGDTLSLDSDYSFQREMEEIERTRNRKRRRRNRVEPVDIDSDYGGQAAIVSGRRGRNTINIHEGGGRSDVNFHGGVWRCRDSDRHVSGNFHCTWVWLENV